MSYNNRNNQRRNKPRKSNASSTGHIYRAAKKAGVGQAKRGKSPTGVGFWKTVEGIIFSDTKRKNKAYSNGIKNGHKKVAIQKRRNSDLKEYGLNGGRRR